MKKLRQAKAEVARQEDAEYATSIPSIVQRLTSLANEQENDRFSSPFSFPL